MLQRLPNCLEQVALTFETVHSTPRKAGLPASGGSGLGELMMAAPQQPRLRAPPSCAFDFSKCQFPLITSYLDIAKHARVTYLAAVGAFAACMCLGQGLATSVPGFS